MIQISRCRFVRPKQAQYLCSFVYSRPLFSIRSIKTSVQFSGSSAIMSVEKETKAMEQGKRKREESKTAGEDNPNADICAQLMELGELERTVHGQQWKYFAYRKAAKQLSQLKTRVSSGKEAEELPGIGKGIAHKIDEILSTGGVEKIKEARTDDTVRALEELARVPGIGHANAKKLVDEGITSVEELRKNQHLLNDNQKTGLKYLEDIETPIPRARVTEIGKYLEKQLKALDGDFDVTICGAYRRKEKTILEIVAVITHRSTKESSKKLMHDIVEKLKSVGFISDVLAEGEHRFRGICVLPKSKTTRRSTRSTGDSKSTSDAGEEQGEAPMKKGEHHVIQMAVYPHEQYYPAIFQWTGNDVFVQQMHSEAKAKGFLLNEYGLHRGRDDDSGEPGMGVKINSEEDIFKALGMEYVKPEDRKV